MAKRFKFRKFPGFFRAQRWFYDLRRGGLDWGHTLRVERGDSIFRPSAYIFVSLNPMMGKSLWAAFALLAFLAALTTGVTSMIIQKSWGWYEGLSHRITIQIPPSSTGIVLEADVQQVATLLRDEPGVARMTIYSQEDSKKFLHPWVADEQILKELPIPRLLVVYPRSDTTLDMKRLKQTVESVVPGAYIDDHKSEMTHLATLIFTVGGGAFFAGFLSVITVCVAIVFVIRAAVMANKNTLEALCSVGAYDDFIAREFQSRFLIVGAKGATLGVLCAMSMLFIFDCVLKAVQPRNEDFSFFIGQISPNGYNYLALLVIGILVSGVTTLVARMMVYHQLEK